MIFSCLFSLFSCATQLYVPSKKTANNSLEDLLEGRETYVKNCSGCHQLFAPSKYNNSEWKKKLDWMQPKAKITDVQKKLIYEYLISEHL